jgi:hypothetical protein
MLTGIAQDCIMLAVFSMLVRSEYTVNQAGVCRGCIFSENPLKCTSKPHIDFLDVQKDPQDVSVGINIYFDSNKV